MRTAYTFGRGYTDGPNEDGFFASGINAIGRDDKTHLNKIEIHDKDKGPAESLRDLVLNALTVDRESARAEIARLQAEVEAERDMKESARLHLVMLQEALCVPTEPHQTIHERVLEAATALRETLARVEGRVLLLRKHLAELPITECAASEPLQKWFDGYKTVMKETKPGMAKRSTEMSGRQVFYDDGKHIHSGRVEQMIPSNPDTRLAWTDCNKYIPAGRAFKPTGEAITCPQCLEASK